MQPMDTKIQQVIKMFYYPMWFIKLDKSISCPCVQHDTKVANPLCPVCLGTGHKIKLIRAKAARQATETMRMTGEGLGAERNVGDRIFTLDNLKLQEDDLIVDNDEVLVVQHYLPGRTDMNQPVYYRTITTKRKMNTEMFLTAFHELLAKNGYT